MKRCEIMDRTWMERARREKGYTQAQVAGYAKITTPFYNRIEKGMYTPSVRTGILITEFLGLNVREFLTERPIK